MTPALTPDAAFAALAETWPSARVWQQAGWTFRDGAGGGKRVSATTRAMEDARLEDALDSPLFMLRPGEEALDNALDARGYRVVDRTLMRATRLDVLDHGADPDRWVVEAHLRLAVMEAIWAEGGIGPDRLAVMERVDGPKVFLLGRAGDTPAAVAFVACAGKIAMLHALEVAPAHRRHGLGARLTRAAAHWAKAQGAEVLALAVTEANTGANALYERAGLRLVTRYHYRQRVD